MYKMFNYNPINFGFVILCPNCNFGQLKKSIDSIKVYYPKCKITIVVPDKCKDYSQIPKDQVVIKGGNTILTMMNQGMKSSACEEWNFVINAYGYIKGGLNIKYSYFIESDKDVLFPVLNRRLNFVDADVHGILIRKGSFHDIGDFPECDNGKLLWVSYGLEKEYRFKGVVGARLN